MKKLLSLLISLMLLLPFSVLAEEEVPANRLLAVDSIYLGLADMYPQFKGTESTIRGCLGLQPAKNEDGTFQEGYMMFTVLVETSGQYNVTVRYAAKYKDGQTRCADLVVNEGERIHLPIVGQAEWTNYVDATVTVELVEGVNTLTLVNVEGFDNSMYKAINVDYIEWVLVPTAE
jgi:hypothetical protein